MCTTVRDPIARSAVESAPLLYSLENDVPNLSDGFSDVFDKNNALKTSSTHTERGKLSSFSRHRTIAASVRPSRSENPICWEVAVAEYSMIIPELMQSCLD